MATEKIELREYRIEDRDGLHLGWGDSRYTTTDAKRILEYWHNRLELYKDRSLVLRWLGVKSSER
ncbi:MAG: hypothetical protein LBO78_03265 [Rickettsiales bacterium]|jgi:hypothetical protein|nr:hypothetical protein [Rickettsiales bacterium]